MNPEQLFLPSSPPPPSHQQRVSVQWASQTGRTRVTTQLSGHLLTGAFDDLLTASANRSSLETVANASAKNVQAAQAVSNDQCCLFQHFVLFQLAFPL